MSILATIKQKLTARTPADKYVIWVMFALGAIGTVAVYSAITFLAETKAGGNTEQFLRMHVLRVSLALGVMLILSLVDYRKVVRYSGWFLLGAVGLLIALQAVGTAYGGAIRELRIGPIGFQPFDIAKVALLLYLGKLLAEKQGYIKSFKRSFLPIFFWIFLIVVLIGLEDFSTASIVLCSAVLMCFVGRVSTLHLASVGLVAVGLAYILIANSPERAARLEARFGVDLFPNTDQEKVESFQHEQYQARQARIAFAMGGLTGVGPGKSTQRDFLPAPYNDFIFAIIAEEYGVIGALALLAAFVALLVRGFLRIARHAPDPLGLFLGVGCTAMIALYGFVHAGVASGLLPVTGLPMPLVSYGGTSMLATGVMVGLLLNISRQTI